MKTKLLFLSVFIFQISFSQTSIPGGTVNGMWSLTGSPYNVQGSIQIANGDSLVIQPGVTVNFQGSYKLLVLGKLKAKGTITDSITFTASNTSVGWRGIRFSNTSTSNDSSRIIFCKLQYGKATGSTPDDNGGALYLNSFSKVIISHSRINACSANTKAGGIYLNASNPIITYNTISYNTVSGSHDGGGIAIFASSPIISNNLICNNFSSDGGGIYIESGTPVISSNTISNNTSSSGGGINIFDGNPTIYNNTISNNTSSNGAGINVMGVLMGGSPTISYNNIYGNVAQNTGGGIATYANIIISNNTIYNNTAASSGGGIVCYTSNATIKNNFICNNFVNPTTWHYQGGGGIWCVNSSSSTNISNNVISNNNATNGAGLLCYNASPTFINNTIVNNSATNSGGGLSCSESNPIFTNCIFYGNSAATSGNNVSINDEPSDPSFYYSDIEGGTSLFEVNNNFYTGTYLNNINLDPKFVSPSGGSGNGFNGLSANWSLQIISPCINAGNPTGTYPSVDIAGNPRIGGAFIDMGAYEYASPTFINQLSLQQTNFNVFPIPSKGEINIQSIENIKAIVVINECGQKIYQSTNSNSSIDISAYPNGVYILQIQTEKGLSSKKIVISK